MPNPSFDFENVNCKMNSTRSQQEFSRTVTWTMGTARFFKRRTGILTLAATIERLETLFKSYWHILLICYVFNTQRDISSEYTHFVSHWISYKTLVFTHVWCIHDNYDSKSVTSPYEHHYWASFTIGSGLVSVKIINFQRGSLVKSSPLRITSTGIT